MDRKSKEECVALAEQDPKSPETTKKLKECDDFMKELCSSDNDGMMDRKSKEDLRGQGYCQRYARGRNKGTGAAEGKNGPDGSGSKGDAARAGAADGNASGGASAGA